MTYYKIQVKSRSRGWEDFFAVVRFDTLDRAQAMATTLSLSMPRRAWRIVSVEERVIEEFTATDPVRIIQA